MAMYTRVTVPLDGSALAETALVPAAAVARHHRAPIRVVSVGAPNRHIDLVSYHQALAQDGVLRPGWSTEVLAEVGQGVAGAIRDSLAGSEELLCLATHGHNAVGSLVLGSVAEDVLARQPDPVLLVGPGFDPTAGVTFKTLVVCLDGSPESEQVLPAATAWADEMRMSVALLEVAPRPTPPSAELPPDWAKEAEEREWRAQAARIAYLEKVADSLTTATTVTWDVVESDSPAAAICQFASTVPGAVVAIATRGNVGLRRVALGSVALQVTHQCPVPILVVRSHPAVPDAGGGGIEQ